MATSMRVVVCAHSGITLSEGAGARLNATNNVVQKLSNENRGMFKNGSAAPVARVVYATVGSDKGNLNS